LLSAACPIWYRQCPRPCTGSLQDALSKALKAVAPDAVRDLLFIAANEGSLSAWCALKTYDDQHSHLLSTLPGRTSVTSKTRARRVRSPAGASTSAAASSDGQAAGGQQGAELMAQLLLTSLLADDDCGVRWGLGSSADSGVLLNMAYHEAAKALGELSGVVFEHKPHHKHAAV